MSSSLPEKCASCRPEKLSLGSHGGNLMATCYLTISFAAKQTKKKKKYFSIGQ